MSDFDGVLEDLALDESVDNEQFHAHAQFLLGNRCEIRTELNTGDDVSDGVEEKLIR